MVLKNYIGDFAILSFRFLTIFFFENPNSQLWPMEKSKTSIVWKTSKRRAKRSEIWDLFFFFPFGTMLNFNLFFKFQFEISKFQEASAVWILTGNIQKKFQE